VEGVGVNCAGLWTLGVCWEIGFSLCRFPHHGLIWKFSPLRKKRKGFEGILILGVYPFI